MSITLRILIAVLLGGQLAPAQTNTPAGAAPRDRVKESVDRGVASLLTIQGQDGAFRDPERPSNETALTSLGLLAMCAVGHLPSDGSKEGIGARKALAFLLREDRQKSDGYYGEKDGSRMYGHGMAALTLSELLGMGLEKEQDNLIRQRCEKAIALILRAQALKKNSASHEGGWRYQPDSRDADLSVTIWQLMALRSAKNAGLAVPKEAIDKAVAYLKRSYKSDRDNGGRLKNPKSGFGYEPGNNPEYATTAAGLLALQVCGEYDAPEVIGAADWLKDQKPSYDSKWFLYGTYYYSQGMNHRGGDLAALARQFTEERLLSNQRPDGSWLGANGQERDAGRVYSTALALLSLSVRYHYLPIYQH